MMNNIKNRRFQVWEYHVSHGSLLVRSPKHEDEPTNVDIMFAGVEYMALPRHLKSVEITDASTGEIKDLSALLGKNLESKAITILIAEGNRYPVVAAGKKIVETDMDIFDSPFAS